MLMSNVADDVFQRAASRVGQVLRDKWRLDQLLGVGGTACVYAATHRNGKRGAVKLLRSELAVNEEARRRFLQEGYVANRLDHPGAVAVLDDDTCEDGAVFLVMELLSGQTLEDRVRAAPDMRLHPSEASLIGDRILDVLIAAHDKGVVHRDIKPENVFITTSGEIKILDFGIARLHDATSTGRMTEVGQIMGTPAFMPPEQALGHTQEIDGRTDLWALGAVMFYALSGRLIHEAETLNKVLLSAMTRPAPPLASVVQGVPPALCDAVDRALAFRKEMRWPDARSMQRALRQAMRSLPPPPPLVVTLTDGVTMTRSPSREFAPAATGSQSLFGQTRRRAWAVALAAFSLVLVIGTVGMILFAPRRGARPTPATAVSPQASAASPALVPPAPSSSASSSSAPSSSASALALPSAIPAASGEPAPALASAATAKASSSSAPRKTTSAPTTAKPTQGGGKDIFSQW